MKKISIVLLIMLCLITYKTDVRATCEDDELNDWTEDVNMFFEQQFPHEEYTDENGNKVAKYIPEFSYFLFFDYVPEKIKDKIKVVASDSLSKGKSYEVTWDNDYQNYVIGSYIHTKDKTYVIDIYSKDDILKCSNEKLRTIEYVVPSYNMYSQTTYCQNNMDSDICTTYKNTEEVTEEEFNEIIKIETIEKKNNTILDKIMSIVLEYWYYVLIPVILVSIFFIIKIKVYKKKEEKE